MAGCVRGVATWLLLPLLGAFAVAQQAEEPTARGTNEAPLFVEVDGMPERAFVQQVIPLTVRIGVDAAWLREHGVPLFQQPLDQPFHVAVPWLLGAEDRAVEFVPPPSGVATQRVAVGDRALPLVVAGSRDVGGRRFEVLELRFTWLPLATGTSLVAPIEVRYAFATRFQEDFLRGREPVDRTEATVASPARTLLVAPLPPNAPSGFSGAVGEFTVSARVASTTAQVGVAVPLQLEVRGDGNLARLATISPPPLDDFHVQGITSQLVGGGRTFTLELLPLRAGVTAVPPVTFHAFSPRRGDYVALRTEPVPLRVEPAAGADLPPRVRELIAQAERLAAERAASPWWTKLAFVVAGALLLSAPLMLHRRGARRRVAASLAERVAVALPADPARALAAFDAAIAHHVAAPTFAGEWNALANTCPAPLLARLQQLRSELDHARFGGTAPDAAPIVQALRELHAVRFR